MNAWVMEEPRPLADLLVERTVLDPADRGHIEAVISRHVARYGGDPERCLAAVGAASSVVSDLKRAVADPRCPGLDRPRPSGDRARRRDPERPRLRGDRR
jgi:hypothetical protein